MAASRTTTESRRSKVRRGGRSAENHAVLRWLQVGAVAAGVGAAVAAGQGVASASTGTDGSGPAADSGDNSGTHRPHPATHRTVPGSPATSETDSAASASDAPLHPFTGLLHRPIVPHGTAAPGADPSDESQSTHTPQAPARPVHGLTTAATHVALAGTAAIQDAAAPEAPQGVLQRFAATALAAPVSLVTVPGAAPVSKVSVAELFSARPPYPAQVTATPVTLRSIVTDLSAWSGTSAPDTDVPAVPVGNVLQALWIGVRRVHYTLFNSYPHAAPTQVVEDPTNGVVTGALNGYDADGDKLTYAVVTPPESGTVTLNGGTYTYTPDADLASTGGTDTFTVSIDDDPGNPWHIHGLSQLLGDCGLTRLSTQKVTVTVAPVVATPSIVATTGAADPGTGAVVITTVVTPQTIPVTVTATNSGNGTLVDNKDGTWTYTPSDADRTAASQVGAQVPDDTITFTATNTDAPTKSGTDTVDVAIEPLVNTVIDSYDITRPWSIAVSPDGKTAYVTSISNGTVSIVDTKTGDVTKEIQLGASSLPIGAAVNPSDGSVYVPKFTTNGGVLVINADNTLGITIPASDPRNVAFSPDGKTAYVANQSIDSPGSITVIDTATGDVIGTLPVATNFGPQDLAVSQDGSRLYVVNNNGGGSVAVLDASTGAVAATIPVTGASDLAISPDRSTVYVATTGSTVAVIDTSSNTASLNPITVNGRPNSVAVSPDGKTVYVVVDNPTGANESLAVVDVATRSVVYIPVPNDANTVAVSADGSHAYVTSTTSNKVTVISLGLATPTPATMVSV